MRFRLFAVVTLLAILVAVAPANAQRAVNAISSSISFEFTVGDETLPPGTYLVTRHVTGLGDLEIRSLSGDRTVTVPVITRLAKASPAKQAPHASLVFDKVGDRKFLSEVWMANEDGYLVQATREQHEHVLVK